MFRKFTLAAVATVIGVVAAAKLTAGKHISLSELFEPNKDRPSSVVPTHQQPSAGSAQGPQQPTPLEWPNGPHVDRRTARK